MGPEPQDCSGTSPLQGQGPEAQVPSQGQWIKLASPAVAVPIPASAVPAGSSPPLALALQAAATQVPAAVPGSPC